MQVYIVNRENINEFLEEMEALGYTWRIGSEPTKFNPFTDGTVHTNTVAIYINSDNQMSWDDKTDWRTMQFYKPKRNSTIPETFSKPYGETQNILEDDQFLIDNSEGIVEVDAQVLRSIIIEKLKAERELKVLKEKFEKLEASRAYLQNIVFNIQLKANRFVDLSAYSVTE